MKIKHPINLSKALTFGFVLALMTIYNNYTIAAWIYLSLHGTYGILWLIKGRLYPDKQWEREISVPTGIFAFFIVSLYWVAPFLLISRGVQPSAPLIAAAVATTITGVFLHYSSDAQKYYTLKYQKGLITEGFFSSSRNPNYLGEILIYSGFAMLAQHWLPFVILGAFTAGMFIPNMLKKDESLSRYPEFAEYKKQSGLLLPNIFPSKLQQNNETASNKI
jgi:protein-S-isoprenylcysteine O-methyltransferase Ste14